jgi:hypothetical protein
LVFSVDRDADEGAGEGGRVVKAERYEHCFLVLDLRLYSKRKVVKPVHEVVVEAVYVGHRLRAGESQSSPVFGAELAQTVLDEVVEMGGLVLAGLPD